MNNWIQNETNVRYFVNCILPIISCLFVFIGGIWTVYKYFKEKNKEFYSRILKNVYAPLFEELVKMEYSRKLLNESAKTEDERRKFSVKKVPFITWKGTRENITMQIEKTTVHSEEYNIFDLDNKLKDILGNLDYAPRDLVALVESYFFLEDIKGVPSYQKEKINLQMKIRRNIIIGYKKYRRKLGLKDVSYFKFCYSFFGYIFFK